MDTVRIERFTSRVHAELACSMLVAHGLNARVSGDDVGGVHPDIPYGIGGTAIVVPTDQLDEANTLLDEEFAGDLDHEMSSQMSGQADGEVVGDPDDGNVVASGAPTADDRPWAPSGRTAERRPGMRVFAVVTAVALVVVFASVTGLTAAWWS